MRKKAKPFNVLFMTKVKFAITVNVLILSALFHHLITIATGSYERIFYNLFLIALVYFLASGIYSLYFDVFEK